MARYHGLFQRGLFRFTGAELALGDLRVPLPPRLLQGTSERAELEEYLEELEEAKRASYFKDQKKKDNDNDD